MHDERFRVGDTEDVLRAVGHVPLLVVAAFLVAGLFQSLGFALLVPAGTALESVSPAGNAALTALQFVGFLVVCLVYLDYRDDRSLVALRRPRLSDAAWIVAGLVGLYVLNDAVGIALSNFGVEPAANQAIESGREQPPLLLYLAVVSVCFVAPAEELLFRGLVQGLLRRAAGVVPAVVVTSLVFGLVHSFALVSAGGGAPALSGIAAYVAVAAALGLVLGTLYEYTETLVVPVAIHGLWNALLFLQVYAAESGLIEAAL